MERGSIFMGIMVAVLIFLSVTLYLGVTDRQQASQGNWSISLGNGSTGFHQGMYVSHDGTVYTVSGNSIYAIGGNGKAKWSIPIRSDWLCDLTDLQIYVADYKDNTLYAIVGPGPAGTDVERTLLLAVTESGDVLWETPVCGLSNMQMALAGGRIYLRYFPSFESIGEDGDCANMVSVYDLQGKLQWERRNVFYQYATGPDGILYLINESSVSDDDPLRTLSSTVLYAYYPNGSLYWSHSFSDMGVNGSLLSSDTPWVRSMLYNNGALYVFGVSDLIVVGENGRLQCTMTCPAWDSTAGFDGRGRLYLLDYDYGWNIVKCAVITSDGRVLIKTLEGITPANYSMRAFTGGIGYFVTAYRPDELSDPAGTGNFTVMASDLLSGKLLWSCTIPPANVRNATLTGSNVSGILLPWDASDVEQTNWIEPWVWYDSKGLPYGSHSTTNWLSTDLVVDGSETYFSYWTYSYDNPGFFGMANVTYGGGLYAIGGNGKLLWYKDTDSYITSMTARNGTIYYQVNGGRFGAAGADVTTGFVAAAAYLFFRFFMLGAVSRARSRLDKNENRNAVLAFVAGNPGASLYDITRGLGLNVGTVRYHLLILSINHKVTAVGKSPKSVGYFASNRQYSGEEKLLMSLVRREQVKKLLSLLSDRPGLSNAEIARELGLAESAVSRHMIELYRKGVVTKRRTESGKLTYCIEEKYIPAMSCLAADSQVSYAGGQGLRETLLAEASK